MHNPVDVAYLAGFIDADGSIMIGKQAAARYPRGYHLMPRMTVTGIDRPVLDWIAETFGGAVNDVTRSRQSGPIKSRFRTFHWNAGSQKALTVCRLVAPYLRIKRRQAELLIEFYDGALWSIKGSTNPGRQGGFSIPEEEMERRLRVRDEICALNSRSYLEPIQVAA